VNAAHMEFCASPEWRHIVEEKILPSALSGTDLGSDTIEIGPGPGFTTEVLRTLTAHLTAVELDVGLASSLAERLAGSNVDVVVGDATPFMPGALRRSAVLTMFWISRLSAARRSGRSRRGVRRTPAPVFPIFQPDPVTPDRSVNSARRIRTRRSISSTMGSTSLTGLPAGSSRSQSTYRLPG